MALTYVNPEQENAPDMDVLVILDGDRMMVKLCCGVLVDPHVYAYLFANLLGIGNRQSRHFPCG